MSGSEAVGHQGRARYASTSKKELDRTFPLGTAEQVLFEGTARRHSPWHLPRPVTIRLTTDRLLAVAHYAFQPDRVWELPRDAIDTVSIESRALIVLYRDDGGRSAFSIAKWTGAYVGAHGQAIRNIHDAAEMLSRWIGS